MAAPSSVQTSSSHTGPSGPQQPQLPHQADVDPIAKFKTLLIPRLKKSLSTLFEVAGKAFNQNALQDSGQKPPEECQQMFDKSLEEFYGVCDQIEIALRLALENQSQMVDSTKFSPHPVLQTKTEATPTEGQLYPNYLSNVRTQIGCAKEFHDMLHECVRKLSERP